MGSWTLWWSRTGLTRLSADHWGHVGYALLFLGQALVTQKMAAGFALRLAGELIWLVIGLRLRMTSIWIWGAAGLVVEVYGFIAWS